MTQASVVDTRYKLWLRACRAHGFAVVGTPAQSTRAESSDGVVALRAERSAVIDGDTVSVTLNVSEIWAPGEDPGGLRELNSEGCFAVALRWHIQVGRATGAAGAERLDVVQHSDQIHPRVHRHPYGRPNSQREATHVRPPEQWLWFVNEVLDGCLGDHLLAWDPDEQD